MLAQPDAHGAPPPCSYNTRNQTASLTPDGGVAQALAYLGDGQSKATQIGTGPSNGTAPTLTNNTLGISSQTTASGSPAFVQRVAGHAPAVSSLTVRPSANITAGNRLVVEVGVSSSSAATAASVTDTAGNHYTELLHYKAANNAELSVWSAPITAGSGTRPTITITPSSTANTGAVALEYAGLSTTTDASALDVSAQATGTTTERRIGRLRTHPATSGPNELALGLYADAGANDTINKGSGYTARASISNATDIELLAEDQPIGQGGTPNATASTGANTTWLMATLVFKPAANPTPSTTYYTRDPSGDLLSERTPTGNYYYIKDASGSVIAVTNTNGSVADAYTYDPWGQTTSSTGTAPNSFGFDQGFQMPGGLLPLRPTLLRPTRRKLDTT